MYQKQMVDPIGIDGRYVQCEKASWGGGGVCTCHLRMLDSAARDRRVGIWLSCCQGALHRQTCEGLLCSCCASPSSPLQMEAGITIMCLD